MFIKVYPIEKYDRGLKRKIWVGVLFIIVVFMSLFGGNFLGPISGIYITNSGVFATIFLLLIASIYLYTYQKAVTDTVDLQITETGLLLDGKLESWGNLQGFDIELDPSTKEMITIILLYRDRHHICTLASDQSAIQKFIDQLTTYIPLSNNYKIHKIESRMRAWKL